MRDGLLLLVLVAGCARGAPQVAAAAAQAAPAEAPPSPELEPLHWSTVAEQGTGALVMVEQKAQAVGRCKVRGTQGDRELWSMERCVATRRDWRFVSADGSALLVVHVLPPIDDLRRAEIPIAELYRGGDFMRTFVAADVAADPSSLRVEAGKLMWVSLADEPRVLATGVELPLSNGKRTVLPFVADAMRPAANRQAAGPGAGTAAACPNPCAYLDDAGTYHLVEGLDQIPPKYRARAAPLRSDSIQVVSGSPAPGVGSTVAPVAGAGTEQPQAVSASAALEQMKRDSDREMREKLDKAKNPPFNHFQYTNQLMQKTPGTTSGPEPKRMNPSDFDAKSR
jgi:hypothetical protein